MNVFAYGTLLFAEVMEAVAGARYPSEDAVLGGYRRFRVRERAYPGVVAAAGAETVGRLYRGLTLTALERLDHFEGDLYERRRLPVHRADGSATEAFVYVIPEARRDALTEEPWDVAAFARQHLDRYLAAGRRQHRADDV